jgi:hypothetical protein
MQAVLNLLWDKLLPALQTKRVKADPASLARLTQKLGSLSVRGADGRESSPHASKFFGRKFVFPENEQKLESITLAQAGRGGGATLVVQSAGKTREVVCGYREWKKGLGSFGTYVNQPAAATSAWAGDDTLIVKQCFYETPFYVTTKLRFSGDELLYDAESNVGFGATKRPQLVGRAQAQASQ